MDDTEIKYFVEAALLAAGQPLSVDQLQQLFDGRSTPEKSQIRQAISSLLDDYEGRGLTIKEVASGFRIQIETDMVERLQKLWEQRPPRYSRAMFETLALIAYRQPMTRGEIEEVRGVSVSANIIRSLLEREWIRIVGHRDVPGRPEMFGTTRQFLDYFGLKKLDDLPPLADLSDWESLRVQLDLPAVDEDAEAEAPSVELAAVATAEAGDLEQGDLATLETADIGEIPAMQRASEHAEAAAEGDAAAPVAHEAPAPSGDDGLEPIEATEWPAPEVGENVVQVLEPGTGDADDHEDADASLTGG